MRIAVCVKWVPVVARMKFDLETKRIVRDGVPNELNSYDQLAVQRCIELREEGHDIEVDVYTMGPPASLQGLQLCIAMGADNAYHIVDSVLAGSDTLATARALSLALRKQNYDIMLFGAHSVDSETGQVGPEVAEMLGLPQVTNVCKLNIVDGSTVQLERETDESIETYECTLPAVITVVEGIAPEVFPNREAVQKAREFKAVEISAQDLSSDLEIFGQKGSPTWVEEIQIIESGRDQNLISEETSYSDAAKSLTNYLKQKGVLEKNARTKNKKSSPLASVKSRQNKGPSVLVVADITTNGIKKVTFELLGAASKVADAIQGHVICLAIGSSRISDGVEILGKSGADIVITAIDDCLEHYNTSNYAQVLESALQEFSPYAVLLSSTINGRDLAARVAGKLGLGLTGDCVGLEVDEELRLVQLKPAFGGNIVAPILSSTSPYMSTIRPGLLEGMEANPDRSFLTQSLALDIKEDNALRLIDIRTAEEGADTANLEDAWAVLCVGMGVGSKENIKALEPICELLGAELICTRDVVDAGWMSRQRQIGLTGRSVAPSLYIGVGVRGDFNHTVGIQRSGTIVAINNNARAQFFRSCDFGVVTDWEEFIPALVQELKIYF